jgi:hypothetical protein
MVCCPRSILTLASANHPRRRTIKHKGSVFGASKGNSFALHFEEQGRHPVYVVEILDTILNNYSAEGHNGLVYILKMRPIEEVMTPKDTKIQAMILARNRFTSSIGDVLARHGIVLENFSILGQTRLFTPAVLFNTPAIVKAVQEDGRPDCLNQPTYHMLHDNAVAGKFQVSIKDYDSFDFLERRGVHIAVTMAEHEHDFIHKTQGRTFDGSSFIEKRMLGLSPLHVAAIHGHTYIFAGALTSNRLAAGDLCTSSSKTRRTCLHWAACFGHVELVEYLLFWLQARGSSVRKELMQTRDIQDNTAIQLAAEMDTQRSLSVYLNT